MDISWDDVQLFLAVAETGSLSAAARRLGIGQPTASRRVAVLEDRLGFPVFERSVEGARLSPAGERLVEPARRMAEWSAEFDRAAEGSDLSPAGVVRLTAPPGIAFEFVAPFAAQLRESLPEVQLQVLSAIRYLDLTRREADLALRFEAPTQRDLVTIASVDFDNVVCAAPAYAETLPPKPTVTDLDWIAWAPPLDHLSPNPELASLVPGFQPAFASDDFLVQTRACEAGVGAMVLGRPASDAEQGSSTLVALDVDLGLHARSRLHLVAAKSALAIPRVRAVMERLLRTFPGSRRGAAP